MCNRPRNAAVQEWETLQACKQVNTALSSAGSENVFFLNSAASLSDKYLSGVQGCKSENATGNPSCCACESRMLNLYFADAFIQVSDWTSVLLKGACSAGTEGCPDLSKWPYIWHDALRQCLRADRLSIRFNEGLPCTTGDGGYITQSPVLFCLSEAPQFTDQPIHRVKPAATGPQRHVCPLPRSAE